MKPASNTGDEPGLAQLYQNRFTASDIIAKERVWSVLCDDFFSRYVKPADRVLDLAAGYCEFINHINCAEKYAYDANPETSRFAARDVKIVVGDCRDLSGLAEPPFDVVFVSNFFEHLERTDIDRVLQQVFQHLRPGGRLLIVQPNIKYLGARYWDFFDHVTPLTHLSMREALAKHGFSIEILIPKFLPYTFKSRFPTARWMVRLYLKMPPAWRLLGKQMFIVATRPPVSEPRI